MSIEKLESDAPETNLIENQASVTQSSYELALKSNAAKSPTKQFVPTQIGVIYEENSLIASVQDDSVFFDRGMSIFEFTPPTINMNVMSKNAFSLCPKKRPLSTKPLGYKEGEVLQKLSNTNTFLSTRGDTFRKFSFETKNIERKLTSQNDKKRENMPIIISTKEVLKNIYSNGHVLPKIRKGIFNKKSTIPRRLPIALSIGPMGSSDSLSKTQQFRNQLCGIKEEDSMKDMKGNWPGTSCFVNNFQHKVFMQCENNSIKI